MCRPEINCEFLKCPTYNRVNRHSAVLYTPPSLLKLYSIHTNFSFSLVLSPLTSIRIRSESSIWISASNFINPLFINHACACPTMQRPLTSNEIRFRDSRRCGKMRLQYNFDKKKRETKRWRQLSFIFPPRSMGNSRLYGDDDYGCSTGIPHFCCAIRALHRHIYYAFFQHAPLQYTCIYLSRTREEIFALHRNEGRGGWKGDDWKKETSTFAICARAGAIPSLNYFAA